MTLVSSILKPYQEQLLLYDPFAQGLEDSYRIRLAQAGIAFQSQPEAEASANTKRLASVAELKLLSMAGELALRIDREADLRAAEGLKSFTLTGMTIEEWPRPWHHLVADDFTGGSLAFPLDGDGVLRAASIFHEPALEDLSKKHFNLAHHIGTDIILRLHSSEGCEAAPHEEQVTAGRLIGPFYQSSPEGCNEAVQICIELGVLTAQVNWTEELRQAAQAARDFPR